MKKNTPPSGGGHGERNGDAGKLIEGAFERPRINEGGIPEGEIPTAIKEGVGEMGEKVVNIIKDL